MIALSHLSGLDRVIPQVKPVRLVSLLEPEAMIATPGGVDPAMHLKIEMDGTQPQPAGGMALNVGMLYPFIPQTRALAPDPRTPIVIVAELGSAPIVQIGQSPTQPYGASVGEGQLSVWIDYIVNGGEVRRWRLEPEN